MQKVKNFFSRIGRFIWGHKWASLLVVLALGVGLFFLWDSFSAGTFNPDGTLKLRPKKETRVRAPISGRLVAEDVAKRKPVAVVIENSPDARPQSGLNDASLVFETFAEGGITRFLVLFQEGEPKEIGPVRSARNYFVEWAKSYNALFAHVGGSSDALDLIQTLKVLDINQFAYGSFFWRDPNRFAPHNVYTTLAKLYQAASSKGYPTSDDKIPALNFKDDAKQEERGPASSFTVNFNPAFAVTYTYDPTENMFLRSMIGVPQTDRVTKAQIKAKNVIVVFSDFSYGTTRTGEQSTKIRTTGSGNAIFYVDGVKSTGTWKRADMNSITRFYDQGGSEIKLNGGTTWVEVAPTGTVVK